MKYIVSNTIQAPDNEPVTIPWYSGDNLAQAMSALASIAADSTGPSDAVPESIRFKVLSVDMQVIHDPEPVDEAHVRDSSCSNWSQLI